VKAIRTEIRSWNLHLRSDKSIEDLSRMFNPIIRGWLQYYGRFYRSALYPPMRQLDRSLARWADRKYKKLRRHLRTLADLGDHLAKVVMAVLVVGSFAVVEVVGVHIHTLVANRHKDAVELAICRHRVSRVIRRVGWR